MKELNESKEALISILNSTSENDFQNLEAEEVEEFIRDFKDLTERMNQLSKK